MATTWVEPAEVLTAAAVDWDGVWMLVFAASRAAMNLAEVPGADDDLGLRYAALDASCALTELEQRLVDFADTGVAVNFGAVELADRAAAVGVIDDLFDAAQRLTTTLCHEAGLDVSAVLCATRVLILLGSARAKVTGGGW